MPGSRPHARGRRLPSRPSIAIVGASGLVGSCIVKGLQQSNFPAAEVRSCGVRSLEIDTLQDVDLVFLAAPDAVSAKIAPQLAGFGCLVIDLSATFRMDPEVPLLLEGIDPSELDRHSGILAGPNCTNVGLVRVLDVLRKHCTIADLTVTTLQAASGGGRRMLEALDGAPMDTPHGLAGNVVPQCDGFVEDGSTGEERRLVQETRRLLGMPELQMSVTCVRVPVRVGHSLSMQLRSESPLDFHAITMALDAVADIHVDADTDFPTPESVRGKEGVFVGRIRPGSNPCSLQMWIVIDNLLTGAASNAIAMARRLLPQD